MLDPLAGQVRRFLPNRAEFEDLLLQPVADLRDICFDGEGVLLVLRRTKLAAFFGGSLIDLLELPGSAMCMSHWDRALYLVVMADEQWGLYRYDLEGRRLSCVFLSKNPIGAISAVRGGCIIAFWGEDAVYKIFEPSARGDTDVVLLCGVAGAPPKSIASDADDEALFFSDIHATYVWARGRVTPFFPLGGFIAYRNGRLVISCDRTRQLVEIGDVRERIEATVGE